MDDIDWDNQDAADALDSAGSSSMVNQRMATKANAVAKAIGSIASTPQQSAMSPSQFGQGQPTMAQASIAPVQMDPNQMTLAPHITRVTVSPGT